MMRVPTELLVKALLMRCSSAGVPAVVARRGDADAGILFVKTRLLDGTAKLWGPAPPGAATGHAEGDGLPQLAPHLAPEGAPESAVDAYLARQINFDSDLWVVEIEDRKGRNFHID